MTPFASEINPRFSQRRIGATPYRFTVARTPSMHGPTHVAPGAVDAWHIVPASVGPPDAGEGHDAEMAGDAGE
jgi:hypothetical protein